MSTVLEERRGEAVFVDRKDSQIMEALRAAPIYKKQGVVKARPAEAGEVIVTHVKEAGGGMKETENTAKEGEWIVQNPGGEEYIIPREMFAKRYQPTDDDTIFEARGYCRAIMNPYGYQIEILAVWGEKQTGRVNCFIADTCDADGNLDGEPYLIAPEAFIETYRQIG